MRSFEYDLRHGIKNLGHVLRTLRLHLSPGAAEVQRRLLEERSLPKDRGWGSGPWLVVDLHTTRSDGQQGRRSFALITYFARVGYEVVIVANRGFVGNIDRKLKGLLLEQPMIVIPRLETFGGSDAVLLTDRPRSSLPHGFQRQIVLKTSGRFEPSTGELAFPFTLHPSALHHNLDQQLDRLRDLQKHWRLFFSGACSAGFYETHWIGREFKMVPRSRVLEIIRHELPPEQTVTPSSSTEVEGLLSQDVMGFVWVPDSIDAIPSSKWLEVLARAVVFPAAPGVSYPMCHNIIEAMAVGTVPLTEYPEHFDPPLRHGENCFVYTGESGLRSRVREIMRMEADELGELSSAAAEYYDRHISPGAFVRRLEADPRQMVVLHIKGYERPPTDA